MAKEKRVRAYTLAELILQLRYLENRYQDVKCSIRKMKVEARIRIKPTEYSETYTILLKSAPKRKNVEVYVIEPRIGVYMDGRKVPHMYPNGSLCLFYPDYEEWDLREKWGDTLVPWASLWLYYYEIWKETDAWLGGGIHGKPDKESVREVNETDK